jgi:hypothetical protein
MMYYDTNNQGERVSMADTLRLCEIAPNVYHLVHTPSNQYFVAHENRKHVYLSGRPATFALDEQGVLITEHHTKIWCNEHGELWQHDGSDHTNTLRYHHEPSFISLSQLRMLSVHFGFDYDEGLFLMNRTKPVETNVYEHTPLFVRMMYDVIQSQTEREQCDNDPWNMSVFQDIQHLKCNNVGNVGEYLIKNLCEHLEIPYVYEGTKNKNNENGTFDIMIENKRVECKTARLGKHGSFQHETLRKNGCDCHVFVDICPDSYYLTVLPEMSFEQIQELTGRKPHPRKGTTDVFKLDFGEPTFQKLIQTNHTVHVTSSTSQHELKTFFANHFKSTSSNS